MSKDPSESENIGNKWQQFAEQQEREDQTDHVVEDAVEENSSSDDSAEHVSEESVSEPTMDFSAEVVLSAFDAERIALEHEIAKYKDIAIRTEADMENLRRRSERDVSNAHKFANEKLLKELLPVMDSLNRGISGLDHENETLAPMITGMQMTRELLEKALAGFGMEVIDPTKGEGFDPSLHEAISLQPDPESESNTVIQVLEKGYQLNGRVVRAAMVIVAS